MGMTVAAASFAPHRVPMLSTQHVATFPQVCAAVSGAARAGKVTHRLLIHPLNTSLALCIADHLPCKHLGTRWYALHATAVWLFYTWGFALAPASWLCRSG